MQAKRNEHALKEDEDSHTRRADVEDDLLKYVHAHLDLGPYQHHHDSNRQHHDERDHVHKGRAGEDPQPLWQARIEEAVVERDDHARDEKCAGNAHVQRANACNGRDALRAPGAGREVNAQLGRPGREHRAHKVVEREVGDKRLEAAAARLLLGKANGKRHGKEQRKLVEDRPTAVENHGPALGPGGAGRRDGPHDGLGGEERSQTHHDPRKGEEHGGREERAAKPLDGLHHDVIPLSARERTAPRAATL